MTFEVIRSISQFSALRANCRYSFSCEPIISLTDDAFTHLIGDAQTGSLVHMRLEGSLRSIRECFRYVRLRKGERMLLMLCASREVSMSDIDLAVKLFTPLAYDGAHGLALFADIPADGFIADVFIKYEPQSELRL